MLNAVGSGTVDVSTFVVGDLAVSAVFAYNVAAVLVLCMQMLCVVTVMWL